MDTQESKETNYNPQEGDQEPSGRQNNLEPIAAAATAHTSDFTAGSYDAEFMMISRSSASDSYRAALSRLPNSSNLIPRSNIYNVNDRRNIVMEAPCSYGTNLCSYSPFASYERMESNIWLPQDSMAIWQSDPFSVCKNDEDPTVKRSHCSCKKSHCLQRYCNCFGTGKFCTNDCTCLECRNTCEHEREVSNRRKEILKEKPEAFDSKIVISWDDKIQVSPTGRHKTGCNCPKSKCIKRYCECYKAGVGCSVLCRCDDCQNYFGTINGLQSIRSSGLQQNEERSAGDSHGEEPESGSKAATEVTMPNLFSNALSPLSINNLQNSMLPSCTSFPSSLSTAMLEESGQAATTLGPSNRSSGLQQNNQRSAGDSHSEEPEPGNETANEIAMPNLFSNALSPLSINNHQKSLLPYCTSFPSSSSTDMLEESKQWTTILGHSNQLLANHDETTTSEFSTQWSTLWDHSNPSSSSHEILGQILVPRNGYNFYADPLRAVSHQFTGRTTGAQNYSYQPFYNEFENISQILKELPYTELSAGSLGKQSLPPPDNVQEGISPSPPASTD